MSALLESLAAGFRGDAGQRMVLDAALHAGLPQPRSEAWKYTSLRALERRAFASASRVPPAIDAASLESIPAPRIVFVNGMPVAHLSRLEGLPAGVIVALLEDGPGKSEWVGEATADDAFARLGLALASQGVRVDIPAGTRADLPLHLVFVGAAAEQDQAWHLLHEISVGEGAAVTLVEHQFAHGAHAHLVNAQTRITLQSRAQLLHARVQHDAPAATLLTRTDAGVGENALYHRIDLELGAAFSRHELRVRLTGRGAALAANGVLMAQARRHVDTRLRIDHDAGETTCDLLWRGLATDRGRVVFHGGITIHAGADGSNARLSSKNLLLSDSAEIDAQPVLEIHADEVKAAHGATVGQLDPAAMFYLRTRGLAESDARRLLTTAFCREPLGIVADAALRELLMVAVDEALGRAGAE